MQSRRACRWVFRPIVAVAIVPLANSLASAQTSADLAAFAKTLPLERIGSDGSSPGQAMRIAIPTSSSGLTIPVPSMVITKEFLWLSKDVLATTFDPLNPFDFSNVTTDIVARLSIPGTNNTQAKLNQFQVKELQVLQIPLNIAISWSVSDGANDLTLNEDYLLSYQNLKSTEVDITVAPVVFHEDKDSHAPKKTAYIRAVVTLTAPNGATSGPVALQQPSPNGLPVDVPALGVPKILALFNHGDFGGWVTFLVPSDSRIGSATTVANKVEALQNVAANLRAIPRFAAFLTGLSNLTGSSEVHFHRGSLDHLDDINVDGPGTVEDRATSLIFVGAPGVQVELYNKPNYWIGEGAFTVFAPRRMITTIADLDNNESGSMSSSPSSCVFVNHNSDDDDGFDDNMSSVSFGEKMGGGSDKDDQRTRCLAHTG